MSKKVIATMPGRILSIDVKVGESVETDTLVLMMESMKMEMEVRCEESGVVKDILVSKGDMVNADDILVILE